MLDPLLMFIIGGGNTVWYGGVCYFVVTSHVSLEEGNTILVCPSSYVALRMSDKCVAGCGDSPMH